MALLIQNLLKLVGHICINGERIIALFIIMSWLERETPIALVMQLLQSIYAKK